MKRTDFEARMSELGLNFTAYGDAAYYGAAENLSVSLHPFPTEMVKHAKLATSATGAERSIIVDTFLVAADVKKTPQLTKAIDAGDDFRGKIGPKDVSFTTIGSEMLLSVME